MAAVKTETVLSVKFVPITWIPATRIVPVITMVGVAAVLEQDKWSAMIEQVHAQPLPTLVPSTTLQEDAAVFVRGVFIGFGAMSCQHSPDMDAIHQTLQDDAVIFGSVSSSNGPNP